MPAIRTGRFAGRESVTCAEDPSGQDRTLCGDAFDLTSVEDVGVWVPHTEPQPVNCPQCMRIILFGVDTARWMLLL